MKQTKPAARKDGADPMREMRERYDRAVEADKDNRLKANEDLRFVAVPGNQWDTAQLAMRGKRPHYEFPILRSHWRQVVNDQKKARPGIKVRAVRDETGQGAELRQGIIRNIESTSRAERAYDSAFELLVAAGMGAWRVTTRYADEDGWDQDFAVEPIKDALNSVWADPDALPGAGVGEFCFVEESMSRDRFKRRWPKAQVVGFDANTVANYGSWYGEDEVRVAEYWRKEPVVRELCLLSDGRTVEAQEYAPIADELAAQGIECVKTRKAAGFKVVMSIVSGAEELEGPFETVFHDIPIILLYANRHFVDGKWHWMGLVRPSRDSQKLINYNFTTSQELIAKQLKSTPLVTPKMLEGEGIKALWNKSNAIDLPYLPYTPDPVAPGGAPTYLTAPPIHGAFLSMGQVSVDMLKATDGIYDASVGARSNETSGRAIIARQREGDTATFDYQDKLAEGIQRTGELIGRALPKVYDTPRVVRVIGKDGGETWKQLYQEVVDEQTGQVVKVNDLSQGKYDYTVSTGPSYDTQRMEFVDTLVNLGNGNPAIAQAIPDLIVGSMDFPKAAEAEERLKLLLPPPIQQAQAQKDASPAVVQMQAQLKQLQDMAEARVSELQAALADAEKRANSVEADILRARRDWYSAITDRLAVLSKDGAANDPYQLALTASMGDALHPAAQVQPMPPYGADTSGDPAA